MDSMTEEELTITEEIIDEDASIEEETETLDKVVQKPKKPRTQKQLDALAKARQTRKDNLKKKKELKEQGLQEPSMIDNLPTESVDYLRDMALAKPVKKKPRKQKVIFQQPESSSEEEIVYVPAPKKKKKKKKKIVYQQPDYTSSSDEEVIEKVIQKPKRVYRKKVSLKVSDSEDEEEAYVYTEEEMNGYGDYQYKQPQQPLKYSDVFRFV